MGEPPVADLDQARVTSQPMNPVNPGHTDGHRRLLRTAVSTHPIPVAWTLTSLAASTPSRAG